MPTPPLVIPCWTRLRPVFSLACLLLTLPVHAFSLSGTVWAQAAAEQQQDPLLLYAIALAESARPREKNTVAPWPWTLNASGKGRYFESHDTAATYLAQHTTTSSNIDIGIMQVNLRWHGHRVDNPQALLEPDANIHVAATILREAIDSAPSDLELGVGRYHSSDPSRARAYGRRVLGIYQGLARLGD